jgi:hypothetical protein
LISICNNNNNNNNNKKVTMSTETADLGLKTFFLVAREETFIFTRFVDSVRY